MRLGPLANYGSFRASMDRRRFPDRVCTDASRKIKVVSDPSRFAESLNSTHCSNGPGLKPMLPRGKPNASFRTCYIMRSVAPIRSRPVSEEELWEGLASRWSPSLVARTHSHEFPRTVDREIPLLILQTDLDVMPRSAQLWSRNQKDFTRCSQS